MRALILILAATVLTPAAAEQRLTLGTTSRATLHDGVVSVDPSSVPIDLGWQSLDDHATWALDARMSFGRTFGDRFAGPDPIGPRDLGLAFTSAWALRLGPLGTLELGGVLRLEAIAGQGALWDDGTAGVVALDRLLAWRAPAFLGNRLRLGVTAGLLGWPMTFGDTRSVSRAGAVFLAGLTDDGGTTPVTVFVEDDITLLPHLGLVLQARAGWADPQDGQPVPIRSASFSALFRVRL